MQWKSDVLPIVKQVLQDFKGIGVYAPTIRAVYYKLYSMGALRENSMRMYKGLDRVLTDVRMEGRDPIITPDAFSDESRSDIDSIEIETPQLFAANWVKRFDILHEYYDPPIWYSQPKYIEVWIEKQAMYTTFESILSGKQVVIQSSRGFNSLTSLYKAYRRLKAVQDNEEREIVILYFGDLDPSGDFMDEDIRNRLSQFGQVHGWLDFKFVRVAVKPEHVREYNLPQDPDEDTAQRLQKNDTRTRRFLEKYGRLYAIELDALAGQEPQAFKDLVLDAVNEHWNRGIWDQVKGDLTRDKAEEELKKRIKIQRRQ